MEVFDIMYTLPSADAARLGASHVPWWDIYMKMNVVMHHSFDWNTFNQLEDEFNERGNSSTLIR